MNRQQRRAEARKTGKPQPAQLAPLTGSQRAIDAEIHRQILKADRQYSLNFAACVLWALHVVFGFGPVRLRRFWEAYDKIHRQLRKYYELDAEDEPFVCLAKLREIGVELEKWEEEAK